MYCPPVGLENLFPCWETLTPEQQTEISAVTEMRTFQKGDRVHTGSDHCSGLLLLRKGQLRAYILSESGKEITLYRLFAMDICLFTASCMIKNINFDLQVQAERDTEVFVVPATAYAALEKTSLAVMHYTNQLMASRFSDVMWVMEQVLFKSFDCRLALFLLEQRAIDGTDTLLITHDEIARHMGSAREVVTKMLNYLASEKMVTLARGKITLIDVKRLKVLADCC